MPYPPQRPSKGRTQVPEVVTGNWTWQGRSLESRKSCSNPSKPNMFPGLVSREVGESGRLFLSKYES